MRTTRRAMLMLVACLGMSSWAAAEEPLIKVDALGVPDLAGRGDGVNYFLWYDAEGWHLRTDSGGKKHVYTGLIQVEGGKLTSISDFENLEAGRTKKKKRRPADVGVVNKAKTEITYRFTTSKKHDGFDFQVDEAAKNIRFKLMIDGKAVPGRILVGAASKPAPGDVFTLPAKPE